MGLWPNVIMSPLHVHGARTEREYEALQRRMIANGRIAHHALNWRDPWESEDQPPVFISGGKWLVRCECGNAPSVHPEWLVSRCFECGAIYRGLALPVNADRIEAVLALRPRPSNRAWSGSETVEDLVVENVLHGVKVPDSERALDAIPIKAEPVIEEASETQASAALSLDIKPEGAQ